MGGPPGGLQEPADPGPLRRTPAAAMPQAACCASTGQVAEECALLAPSRPTCFLYFLSTLDCLQEELKAALAEGEDVFGEPHTVLPVPVPGCTCHSLLSC